MAISPNRPQPCYCHELQNPPIRSGSRPSPLENNNKKDSLTSHKHSLSSSSSNKTQSFQTSSSASTKETFRNLTREILNSELFLRSDSKIVQSEEAEPVKFNPMSVTSLETSLEVPIILSEEQTSYTNMADGNPFYGEHQYLWNMSPEMEMQQSSPSQSPSPKTSSYQSESVMPLFSGRHIPHSVSEKYIVDRPEPLRVRFKNPDYATPSYGRGEKSPIREYEVPVRGRSRERFNDDYDDIDFDLDSPPRRSRSPHKKLFGENGWLGRSASMKDNEKYRKTPFKSLGEKIKQHVEGLAGDVAKAYTTQFSHPKIVTDGRLPISLDPPTQAKLYSEIEAMICVSANKFLLQQYKEGRLSVESINKATNFWASKNRPQVPEFQFDQATQRDLVLHNIRTLDFNGEYSTNPVALNSTLHNWKAVAKEMSVRTFCNRDSVIRKHMHDTYKILEMLGAPLATFLAFQELQMKALAMMKEHTKKTYHPRNSNGHSRSSSEKHSSNNSY
ncbi:hypothetical protein DTO027B5_6022 [Paecilomyces variotii]|nr:hypothetical protein DTO032I3_7730 [Paecilomyces variotii]KAJ9253721.1 hypothetical protein DTO195F2_6942 [Paecilomyces variotii]KAJ9276260.1 hypothetical protein DTO021D3_6891 [Paecilomyces variotii]KAJ9323981.1 hypothetical protein DTO027B3_5062 [Paecilomyces variotii]KAJ9332215.1 hypothetical protein DTO027B5_6022 [Paecilomyces variotii]